MQTIFYKLIQYTIFCYHFIDKTPYLSYNRPPPGRHGTRWMDEVTYISCFIEFIVCYTNIFQ